MKITRTTKLSTAEKSQVLTLWNSQYPVKLAYHSLADFDVYLQNLTDLTYYLWTDNESTILGWASTFTRDNEKWFAIILTETLQGKGFGRKMLDELKQHESVLNGWVIDHDNDLKKNGEFYKSPLKFYVKCDFNILTDQRIELEKISAVKIKWTKP